VVRGHRDTEHRTQDTQEHVHGHNDKTNTRHRTQTHSRAHNSTVQVHKSTRILIQTTSHFISG
ncbi:hypothetical protein K438DRAFT_1862117, partial [Mycena galopus ATCC 62051]